MRLIRICLENNVPFWFFKDIQLTTQSRVSNLFDIDNLEIEELDVLNSSIMQKQVKAFDTEDMIVLDLKSHKRLGGGIPDNFIDDVDVDEIDIPEVISITCDSDEEPEEDNIVITTDEDRAEAELLLSKNGNTVKKTILNFDLSSDTVGILQACLELESQGRGRVSVLKATQERVEEYYG